MIIYPNYCEIKYTPTVDVINIIIEILYRMTDGIKQNESACLPLTRSAVTTQISIVEQNFESTDPQSFISSI